jgi:protein phosphatase
VTPQQARQSTIRNLVTRALGAEEELSVEVHEHAVERGDVYLFCSDGLNDMLTDDEITGILLGGTGGLEQTCAELVSAANEAGGADNVSVALVYVDQVAG